MPRINIHSYFLVLIIFMAVNIFFLDYVVFSKLVNKEITVLPEIVHEIKNNKSCDQICLSEIEQKINNFISIKYPLQTPTPFINVKFPKQATEYYIPLGSGSTSSSDWDDLLSLEANIDTKNYPNIKKVYFESYLRIGTGNGTMYAKLYNITDSHDVWFSEVSQDGGGTVRREAEIKLDAGDKLYRVKAKSRLQTAAFIENARIKIIFE